MEWKAADDGMRLQLLSIAGRFCCPPPLSDSAATAAAASAAAAAVAGDAQSSPAALPTPPECADEANKAAPPAGEGETVVPAGIEISIELEHGHYAGGGGGGGDGGRFGIEFVTASSGAIEIIECPATERSAMQAGDQLKRVANTAVTSAAEAASALQSIVGEERVAVDVYRPGAYAAQRSAAAGSFAPSLLTEPEPEPEPEPASAEDEAAAEAKIQKLQQQVDTATEQLYAGDRDSVASTDGGGGGGSGGSTAKVRSIALALWQGQGRHPDLEESLAELCLLLSDDDASAYGAAREGFLQPLLGHLAPSAALVDAALEVVLSFFNGGKSRHLAIAAGLTADLENGDDFVARAICALFAPLRILVGPVVLVATQALAAKAMLAMAQAVQSTPGNTGMDPVMKALWATSHSVDNCFECRLGAVAFVDQPEETKASKKKKLKLPPLALDAMMPLTTSSEVWLAGSGKAFVELLAELPCPSAWSAKHVSNALERMSKANKEEKAGVNAERVW